jgi:hypothetical protein
MTYKPSRLKGEIIMPIEILHFRGSDKILKDKNLLDDVRLTMEYIDDVLTGALYKRELLRMALDEMDWTKDADSLRILENRRYMYKGFKRGAAIDGNLSVYEYILEGMLRLQIGYTRKRVDTGILLLTSKRSEKSPYGSTSDMVKEEIAMLVPTIRVPVSVCLFDTGEPILYDEEGNEIGTSIRKDDNPTTEKTTAG